MTVPEIIRALGPIDIRSVRRDPLLRWLILYPLLLAALMRWSAPLLRHYLLIRFQFDLQPYYPLLASSVMLMTPILAGSVVGFLLLDQKDDHTLMALQVTPLSLSGYFAYRLAIPTALSFVLTVVVLPMTRLATLDPPGLMAAALSSCLLAPLWALFLGAFAANKVQGFALSKAVGILLVPPLIAYFVDPPWQFLFGLDPLYWPSKFLWLTASSAKSSWLYLVVGVLVEWILLRFLMQRMMHLNHST
jgi:fluoroquinolone transport system permease protein